MAKGNKAALAVQGTRHRASMARQRGRSEAKIERLRGQLRAVKKATSGEALSAGLGAHAGAIVAGQITRNVGGVRGKPELARVINYAGGIAGLYMAATSKKSSMRVVGASMTSMSVVQLAFDTVDKDLIPDFGGLMGGDE